MNPPEKEHFLKIYRDMLEFEDGFVNGIGADYDNYLSGSSYTNRVVQEMSPSYNEEDFFSFRDFFLNYINPIYKKIDDWLATLPAEQQRLEVVSLMAQIKYYIALSEKYVVVEETSQKESYLLLDFFPEIKESLVDILKRCEKHISDEQSIREMDRKSVKNQEFTTARQVAAIMLLDQKFALFKTQDKINIQNFIEFLTSKTPRDIGDAMVKFNEGKGVIHKSKKQNQKDYEFLKDIFQKADCNKVTQEIESILLKISKLEK